MADHDALEGASRTSHIRGSTDSLSTMKHLLESLMHGITYKHNLHVPATKFLRSSVSSVLERGELSIKTR